MKALKFYWDNSWFLIALSFALISVLYLLEVDDFKYVLWGLLGLNAIAFIGLMIQFTRRKV